MTPETLHGATQTTSNKSRLALEATMCVLDYTIPVCVSRYYDTLSSEYCYFVLLSQHEKKREIDIWEFDTYTRPVTLVTQYTLRKSSVCVSVCRSQNVTYILPDTDRRNCTGCRLVCICYQLQLSLGRNRIWQYDI